MLENQYQYEFREAGCDEAGRGVFGRAGIRRCGDPSARFSRPVAQRFEADDRAEPGQAPPDHRA